MKNNQKAEQLIKVMQNQTPEIDFTPQEMINAIESELLETLWMELANLDKIVFQFTPYDAEARGSTFGPIDDEWIREYFSNPNEYIAWVDIEYEIDYENILDAIEQDFSYYPTYVNYVFSLEYGLNNNHLNISRHYNSKNDFCKGIDNLH